MATREIDAATTYASATGAAELDLANRQFIESAAEYARPTATSSLDVGLRIGVDAASRYAAPTTPTSLSLLASRKINAASTYPKVRAPADLLLGFSGVYPPILETADRALLGDTSLARGPGSSIALAGSRSEEIVFVHYRDPVALPITGRRATPGRVLSMASTVDYLFAITDQRLEPDDDGGSPLLLVWGNNAVADPELARLELPRSVQPRFLWGPDNDDGYVNDDGDLVPAPFIVLTGDDGAVEIRTADPDLTILAEAQTGVYRPRVVEVVRKLDLDQTGTNPDFSERVWWVVIFSETSAQGVVLEYRDRVMTYQRLTPADINIAAPAGYAPVTGTADLEQVPLSGIVADVSYSAPTATTDLTANPPPPDAFDVAQIFGYDAAVATFPLVLPFSVALSGPSNRVVTITAGAMDGNGRQGVLGTLARNAVGGGQFMLEVLITDIGSQPASNGATLLGLCNPQMTAGEVASPPDGINLQSVMGYSLWGTYPAATGSIITVTVDFDTVGTAAYQVYLDGVLIVTANAGYDSGAGEGWTAPLVQGTEFYSSVFTLNEEGPFFYPQAGFDPWRS